MQSEIKCVSQTSLCHCGRKIVVEVFHITALNKQCKKIKKGNKYTVEPNGGQSQKYIKERMFFFFLQKPRIVGESRAALKLWYISGVSIPDNCYGHHGRCPCKNILSGVTFSRLNTETAYIWLFRDIFECFGGVFSQFSGVKFGIKKCCLCKINDKYQVWRVSWAQLWENIGVYIYIMW